MTNNVWGYFLSTNLFFSSKKIFLTKFQKIALERNFDLEQKKKFFLKITDYVATISLKLFHGVVYIRHSQCTCLSYLTTDGYPGLEKLPVGVYQNNLETLTLIVCFTCSVCPQEGHLQSLRACIVSPSDSFILCPMVGLMLMPGCEIGRRVSMNAPFANVLRE